jgi:hypothetical protein
MFINAVKSSLKKTTLSSIFKDKKLFFLVTLKTFQRSLLFLAKNCWGLILALFILRFAKGFEAVSNILNLLLFFIAIFVVRPSIERKSRIYFIHCFKRFFSYLFVCLIAFIFYWQKLYPILIQNVFLKICLYIILIPAFLVGTLCFFDTAGGINNIFHSILRTIKIVLLNIPMVLFWGFFSLFVLSFVKYKTFLISSFFNLNALKVLFGGVGFVFLNLFILFFMCVASTFYIKARHRNYKLIFG